MGKNPSVSAHEPGVQRVAVARWHGGREVSQMWGQLVRHGEAFRPHMSAGSGRLELGGQKILIVGGVDHFGRVEVGLHDGRFVEAGNLHAGRLDFCRRRRGGQFWAVM